MNSKVYAKEFELELARILNGKRIAGSGNGVQKGDILVNSANILIEAKCRMCETFRIELSWFLRIEQDCGANTPVIAIRSGIGDFYYIANWNPKNKAENWCIMTIKCVNDLPLKIITKAADWELITIHELKLNVL